MSFLGVLFALTFAFAGNQIYQVDNTVTIRKMTGNHLEVLVDLPPGSKIRFDRDRRVGAQSYKASNGQIKRSNSGWIRGLSIESSSALSRSQMRRFNRMRLYMSETHLSDVYVAGRKGSRRPGKYRPGKQRRSKGSYKDKVTHYFTYKARSINRKICKMEGTMIVGGALYVWTRGKCRKASINCKYGMGNRNNCLTPCKSIAADKRYWKNGTRVYIAKLDGATCPSTGRRMDGNFVVADVGAWIKGKRRFDIFMGICVSQSGGVCHRYVSR